MCVLLFSPGKTVQVDYAAESITLKAGGRTDIIDLLVTNHSDQPIERLHLLYPHAIPLTQLSPAVDDITTTLTEGDKSPYNVFYFTEFTHLAIDRGLPEDKLTVSMLNPNNVVETVHYEGYIKGSHRLIPYEVAGSEVLTEREWYILSQLGWSAFTIKFDIPMEKNEARWLRLSAETGVLSVNDTGFLDRLVKKYLGILTDTFEIAGPLDVRYRFKNALTAAGVGGGNSEVEAVSRMVLHSLFDKIITRGVGAADTVTVIKDWRLNVFRRNYTRCDQPHWWGDIIPCGPLVNLIKRRNGIHEECYQWKAGDNNLVNPLHGGFFRVRIQAHDEPMVRVALPWIAFCLGVVNLLWKLYDAFKA